MNVLAYSTQDPQKVAAKVEEKLHEELGNTAPIPFIVEQAAGTGVSVGSLLSGLAKALVGGSADLMYTLVFDIATPRKAQLRANVSRQGIGCHVGGMLLSTGLSKAVAGEVILDDKRAQFHGDAATIAKLNVAKDLMKRIDKLARTTANLGGLDVTVPRLGKIVPDGAGSTLVIGTLGRSHALGFKMSIDANEFIEIAAAIEAIL